MSPGRKNPRGYGLGLGMFFIGLGFILAASMLNVAHDRFTRAEFAALPETVSRLYEGVGKTGVTVILVCTGLLIMGLGLLNASGYEGLRGARGTHSTSGSESRAPYFCTANENTPQAPPGRVALETRKYVAQAALSGIPGWSATTRKPPEQ